MQILGRDQTVDVQINDPEVSRKHLKVLCQNGQVIIEDMGSTNGTFVNNMRISGPYVLRPGELIFLGEHVTLEFGMEQEVEATAAAPLTSTGGPPPLQAQPFPTPEPIKQDFKKETQNKEPATPAQQFEGLIQGQPAEAAPKKKLPRWAVILIIVIILLIVLCVLPIAFIDGYQGGVLWCKLFGPIFRAISPGTCPLP